MRLIVADSYQSRKSEIESILHGFDQGQHMIGSGTRNQIKIFKLAGQQVNVKSFKIPNPPNRLIYRFWRPSKAARSFTYANILLDRQILTPMPIAYGEDRGSLLFGRSYYISEHLEYDLTYRDLLRDPYKEDHTEILRAFTRFTYSLQEKEVEFLDHSPGNTLIRRTTEGLKFYLVDLNRMNFRPLSFEERMKNFSRLTSREDVVEIMASEYALISGEPQTEVFRQMWKYTQHFQNEFHRKKKWKKKLFFWRAGNQPVKEIKS